MKNQIELFPNETWNFNPNKSQNQPFLWIKEFRFYSEFHKDKLVRKYSLRPGINILWAKPAEVDEIQLKQGGGLAGHSAGKSLFCRLLRFLLGESTFATKPVKDAILNRFINAVVVAEIIVSGKHWLIIRHLQSSQGEVLRDATIEQLFEDNLFKEPYKAFRGYIDQAIMQRMSLKTFPGNGKSIEWGHILPFLTRDQECRMQNLAQWRSPLSESDAPSPSVAENCHIIRGLLNLMNEEEEKLIRTHSRMLARRSELEKDIPSLNYHYRKQKEILLRDFPSASIEQFQLTNDDMLVAAFETLDHDIQKELNNLQAPSMRQFDELLSAAAKMENQVAVKAAELKEQKRLLRLDIARLRQLTRKPSKSKLSWRDENANAAPNRCNVLFADAKKKGCPFATVNPIDFASHINFQQAVSEAIKDQEIGIGQQRKYISTLLQELKQLTSNTNSARELYQKSLQSYNDEHVRFLEKQNFLLLNQRLIRDAQKAYNDVVAAQDEQKKLEGDIKLSLEDQKIWRSHSDIKKREQYFNEIFQEILRNVLEPQLTAKIETVADRINIEAEYNGNIRGITLDIVKLLAFDYAVLISGLEHPNGHPGFLIHDSPREADMSEDIYQRLLLFMKSIEDKCIDGIPFQYIVTTTAKPINELKNQPFLLLPYLDASSASGRLLGVDL